MSLVLRRSLKEVTTVSFVVVRELLLLSPDPPYPSHSTYGPPLINNATGSNDNQYPITDPVYAATSTSGSLPPDVTTTTAASFKPSIAVIIGVLTTMFSLTFLLLLYAKHCKRSPNNIGPEESIAFPATPPSSVFNHGGGYSGVDRTVVEALPMFEFSSLRGMKEGLECAVCLCRFEDADVLRLLPKCKHAFHLECVDTWLVSHSTCPLCRHFVTAEDVAEGMEIAGGEDAATQLMMMMGRRSRSMTPEEAVHEAGIAAVARTSSVMGANARQSVERSLSGQFQLSRGATEGDLSRRFETVVRKDGLLLSGESAAIGGSGPPGTPAGAGGLHEVGSWGSLRKSYESSSPARISNSSFKGTTITAGGGQKILRRPSPSPDSARRLGHRIVIADVVLQQRWSDFVPSDVLFLHAQTLFGPEEKARVSVSRNDLPSTAAGASALKRDSNVGSSSPFNSAFSSKRGGARQAQEVVALSKDVEMGLEASAAAGAAGDTPRLSAGKPSKSIRLDWDSRTLAWLTRASSGRRAEDPAVERKPPAFQRSMSEITGMDRIAHTRMSSRDLLLAGSSAEVVYQSQDQQDKSRKWSSIARRTLNWVVGGGGSGSGSSSSKDKRAAYKVDKMLQLK